MSESQQRFERQRDWQKTRQTLSWPEKVRMAEKVKESIQQLRTALIWKEDENTSTDSTGLNASDSAKSL